MIGAFFNALPIGVCHFCGCQVLTELFEIFDFATLPKQALRKTEYIERTPCRIETFNTGIKRAYKGALMAMIMTSYY